MNRFNLLTIKVTDVKSDFLERKVFDNKLKGSIVHVIEDIEAKGLSFGILPFYTLYSDAYDIVKALNDNIEEFGVGKEYWINESDIGYNILGKIEYFA